MLINLLLLIVARGMNIIVSIIAILYTNIRMAAIAIYRGHGFMWWWNTMADYYITYALTDDRAGQVKCQHLLNDWTLHPDAPKRMGNLKETASHVYGVDYEAKKVYPVGIFIIRVLNLIEKRHVQKAAKSQQL